MNSAESGGRDQRTFFDFVFAFLHCERPLSALYFRPLSQSAVCFACTYLTLTLPPVLTYEHSSS